jgi:carboxylesterase type B
MGESAGASSILHHLTYEQGNPRWDHPRYKHVIMQSPAFFPQPDTEPLDKVYKDVLSRANVTNLDDLVSVSNETLKKINYDLIFRSPYGQFTFGPTINSSATPDLPGKLIKQGKYHQDVAVLSGYTKLDGLLFTPPWLRNEQSMVDYVSSIYPKSTKEVNDTIKSYKFVKGGADGLTQRLAIMSVSNVLDVSLYTYHYYFMETF